MEINVGTVENSADSFDLITSNVLQKDHDWGH